MLEYVNCNLCGKDDTTPLYQMDRIGIVQCNHCGLVYTNPRLDAEERLKMYNSKVYFLDHLEDVQSTSALGYSRPKAILKYKKPPGKILEIGCAIGSFLDLSRRKGWDVYGVEISEIAGHYAREKSGLNVFIGQLEDAPFAPESFDVICMYHLLEHIPSPKEYCQRLHRLLKQDGLLVIEVPNISSLPARRLKAEWGESQPHQHLYHFTRKSLTDLLLQTGYKIMGISLWGGTGLVKKGYSRSQINKAYRHFLGKYIRYLNWLRMIINFIRLRLFKRYSSITIYARK